MVESTLNYLAAMPQRPVYYTYAPPPGERARNTRGDRRRMPIRNARALDPLPTLDREGFCLVHHQTAVEDLYDPDAVRERYFPEIERLVADATGAERVLVFDHNVRCADRAERQADGAQHPVRYAHNDYTVASGPDRVRDLLDPAEAELRLRGRFAVINVWKPIRGPVLQTPLAVCDAGSIAQGDFVATDLRYRDRTGEVYSMHCSSSATIRIRSAHASPPTAPSTTPAPSRTRLHARASRCARSRSSPRPNG
jgi:hypothetical protein